MSGPGPARPGPASPTGPGPRPLSRRASRIFVTVFFAFLFGFSWWLTRGNRAWLESLRHQGTEQTAFYKCVEVLSGDSLMVVPSARQGDSFIKRTVKKIKGLEADIQEPAPPRRVRIIGIQAPPMEPGSDADAFATAVGRPVPSLFESRSMFSGKHQGEIARDALKVWIYRQNVRLEFPDPNADEAHAILSNVDVGKIVLEEGQAIALDTPHQHLEMYREFEAEGRRRKIGIWRPDPLPAPTP